MIASQVKSYIPGPACWKGGSCGVISQKYLNLLLAVLWKPLIRIWMYDVKVINNVFTVIFLYRLLFLNNYHFITLLQASSFSVHCHVAALLSVDLKLSRILSVGGGCGKMS